MKDQPPKKPDFKNLTVIKGMYDDEDRFTDVPLSHTERYELYNSIYGYPENPDPIKVFNELSEKLGVPAERIKGAVLRAWAVEGSGR